MIMYSSDIAISLIRLLFSVFRRRGLDKAGEDMGIAMSRSQDMRH